MKLRDIYKKNIERKYCNIIDTKGEEIEIKSIPIEKFKKNKYPILIISLIVILILLLTFYNSLKTFFAAIAFLAFILISGVYFNSYSIKSGKDKLHLKWNFQKFDLPYTNIKGIFLARDVNTLDFLPIPSYNLVVRYLDNLNFIRELSFPARLLDADELDKFIDNFIIDTKKADDCVKFEKIKKFKMTLKTIGFVLFAIIIFIIVFASLK